MQWKQGRYTFDWNVHKRRIGLLTITGGDLVLPYHMLSSLSKAQSMAMALIRIFDAGDVPREGQFRIMRKSRDLRLAVLIRLPRPR